MIVLKNDDEIDNEALAKLHSDASNNIDQLGIACEKVDSDFKLATNYLFKIKKRIDDLRQNARSFFNTAQEGLINTRIKFKRLAYLIIVLTVLCTIPIMFFYGIGSQFGVSSLILLISEIIFFYISNFLAKSEIEEIKKHGDELIDGFSQDLDVLHGDRDRLRAEMVATHERRHDVANIGRILIDIVKDFEPTTQKIYAKKEKKVNLDNLKITLRNALNIYGFQLKDAHIKRIEKFWSNSDSPSLWPKEIAVDISPTLGTSKEIILLAYSDYSQNTEDLKNCWAEISSKANLLSELTNTLLRNGVVSTEFIGKNYESYGAINKIASIGKLFTLQSFKNNYSLFYDELKKAKLSLMNTFRTYHLEYTPSIENDIREFVPGNLDSFENRHTELLTFSAKKIDLQPEIVSLIYFEREGDLINCKKHWNSIRSNDMMMEKLTLFLIDCKIIEAPSSQREGKKLRAFISDTLRSLNDYRLQDAIMKVRESFEIMDSEKTRFRNALSAYEIQMSKKSQDEFNNWIPEATHDIQDAICKTLSSRLAISENILLLLYFDYTQDIASRKDVLSKLKKNKQARDLSRIILEGNRQLKAMYLRDKESAVECLNYFILESDDYNRNELETLLFKYRESYSRATDLQNYLRKQNFSSERLEIKPKSEEILSLLEDNLDVHFVEIIRELSKYFIASHLSSKLNDDSWLEPASLSCTVMYASEYQTQEQREANIQASMNMKAVQILYKMIEVREKEYQKASGKMIYLSTIIEEIAEGEYNEFKYLYQFKEALTNGTLIHKIDDLLAKRMDVMNSQLVKLGSDTNKIEKTIQRDRKAVNEMLDLRLNFDAVYESLKMNLINAYMITISTREPVLSMIIDSEILLEACKALAENDSGFSDLILLDTVEKTSGGKYTRMGVVPMGMSFDEFSMRFERVFNEALIRKNVPNPSDYSANLVRIFPIESFFKRVEVTSELGTKTPALDHPVMRIRDLLKESYGPLQNLELIASMQDSDNKTVALMNIIKSFIDSSASILGMLPDSISAKTVSGVLKEKMESREFDKSLIKIYGSDSLSDLAIRIHQGNSNTDDRQKKLFINDFYKKTKEIIIDSGARLEDERTDQIIDAINEILSDIGRVLSRFNEFT